MANMNFGVNILPKTNNTYTLGNSDYKWNIFANSINGINVSNFLNNTTLGGAGISATTYTTLSGTDGEFSVTTATSASYSSPHALASVTGYLDKEERYRITFDGNTYILPCRLWYQRNSNSIKTYTYVGNLGLYVGSTTMTTVPGDTDDVPFLIVCDLDENNSLDIFTETAGTYTITIETVDYTKTTLPKTLIYGNEYWPILTKHCGGTFNGTSIGLNTLVNSRGTIGIGHFNTLNAEFCIGMGINNTITGSHAIILGANNTVTAEYDWVFGTNNTVLSQDSYVLGNNNVINSQGFNLVAVGTQNTVESVFAHAFGYYNIVNKPFGTALGCYNVCLAQNSLATGYATITTGDYSYTLGAFNVQDSTTEWVASTSYAVGDIVFKSSNFYKCKTANSDATWTSTNWETTRGNWLEVVGNGIDANNRSNARVLDWSGNERLKGTLYVGCNSDSSGGIEVATKTAMTGATSSVAGTMGLVPAPATTDVYKVLSGDGTWKDRTIILSYGNTTWADALAAYKCGAVVYCRASSNTNPATGSQTRMAFLAYVNDATDPTELEFQYYRSVSSHSATQLGDEVYVYKLNKTNGWSVTKRDASVKEIVEGTGISVSWASNKVTITGTTVSDSLSDTSTTNALSAAQGKALSDQMANKHSRTLLCDDTPAASTAYNLSDSVLNYDYIEIIFVKYGGGGGAFVNRIVHHDSLAVGTQESLSFSSYNSSSYNFYAELGFSQNNKLNISTYRSTGWTMSKMYVVGIGKR